MVKAKIFNKTRWICWMRLLLDYHSSRYMYIKPSYNGYLNSNYLNKLQPALAPVRLYNNQKRKVASLSAIPQSQLMSQKWQTEFGTLQLKTQSGKCSQTKISAISVLEWGKSHKRHRLRDRAKLDNTNTIMTRCLSPCLSDNNNNNTSCCNLQITQLRISSWKLG